MRSAETKCGEAAWPYHQSSFEGCFSHRLPPAGASVPLALPHRLVVVWGSGLSPLSLASHTGSGRAKHTHTHKQKHARHREHMAAFFCLSCSKRCGALQRLPRSFMSTFVFALKLFSPPGPENMDEDSIQTHSLKSVARMHFRRVLLNGT